jgi:Xaa-Pro dipeptidase
MMNRENSHKRLGDLRQQLRDQEVDCLALVPGANLRYLAGLDFHMLKGPRIAFFPVDERVEPVVLIPDIEELKWEQEAPFATQIYPYASLEERDQVIKKVAAALPNIRSIAVEHLRMRVQEYRLIREYFPDAKITQAEPVMYPLRIIKDPEELSAIRRACEIAEAALEDVISNLRPGITEHEITNKLIATMLLSGGGEPPFDPIVLTGSRSAQIHGSPGQHPIKDGDLLLIDFGTTVNGYACDITRTFIVGREPDEKVRVMYEAVKAGNAAGRSFVKPGMNSIEVDQAVRQIVAEYGFGDLFIHPTGHGFGLDIHEPPFIDRYQYQNMAIEEGMVFTIEPGVYDQEVGGIRIEDDVVVTENGVETITSFGRELRIIGI